MTFGQELIKSLEREIDVMKASIDRRMEHIDACDFDWDDCFVSQRFDDRGISTNRRKIDLIQNGGLAWFTEYATLDGTLVNAKWCKTQYGEALRAEMPDGSVVWTSASTKAGLRKKGLKMVECLRPAWFCFRSSGSGMYGAYTGDYVLFPSDVNYATGEPAGDDPVEMRDKED